VRIASLLELASAARRDLLGRAPTGSEAWRKAMKPRFDALLDEAKKAFEDGGVS
jgi:hypothetical protein